jgi:hypothetical protein
MCFFMLSERIDLLHVSQMMYLCLPIFKITM